MDREGDENAFCFLIDMSTAVNKGDPDAFPAFGWRVGDFSLLYLILAISRCFLVVL